VVLTVVPEFVIVGAQAVGRSSPVAGDILGFLAVHGLSLFFGLFLGLVVQT